MRHDGEVIKGSPGWRPLLAVEEKRSSFRLVGRVERIGWEYAPRRLRTEYPD